VNVRAVLLEDAPDAAAAAARPIRAAARPVRGRPLLALSELLAELDGDRPVRVAITGAGRALALGILDGRGGGERAGGAAVVPANEVTALCAAVHLLCPEARSIIGVGGHTSLWLLLDESGGLLDFALNEQCAAGSGAFIEQQAARLHLDAAGLARAALGARHGAAVAGRCSVFAKSDMIHLQQRAVPLEEIAFGLCLAVARNYVATLLRGRAWAPPVIVVGGCAENGGLVRAFERTLALGGRAALEPGALRVPERAAFFSAIGAALEARTAPTAVAVGELRRSLLAAPAPAPAGGARALAVLSDAGSGAATEPRYSGGARGSSPARGFFLGVDVGSVSTNFAVLDQGGELVDGIYLPTRGQPVEVLREGVLLLRGRFEDRLELRAVGATGSGRHLAAAILGADLVKNEITCQLESALRWFPEADTVIEIGGQDSKLIRAEAGRLVDFAMNKVCAAGTGSFLEEEALRLGVRVEGEFAELALASTRPAALCARCTVFMDTEVVCAVENETPIPDLCAGLAYAIAENYLEKVVGTRRLGREVVLQGGVASNRAVVAAFAALLGERTRVRVHPHNRISGAIGAALLARAAHDPSSPSRFIGLAEASRAPGLEVFECPRCENRCQVSRFTLGDGRRAHFGDACEHYASRDNTARLRPETPDLFAERDRLLRSYLRETPRPRATIGLPFASMVHAHLPFYATLLGELGLAARLSSPSSARTLELGAARLPAETCLPVKLCFGHVQELALTGVDAVLLPSCVRVTDFEGDESQLCPFVQSLPFMVAAGATGSILVPEILLGEDEVAAARPLAAALARFGVTEDEVRRALPPAYAAQRGFLLRLRALGAEALERSSGAGDSDGPDARPRVAVLGKPYGLGDPLLNLDLARHLRRLGVLAFPMDTLPRAPADARLSRTPWRFSRDLLRSLEWVLGDGRLTPIVVSHFGCGPDAFVGKHVQHLLGAVPHLELELDEHRGEAGLITRIEALLDEVEASRRSAPPRVRTVVRLRPPLAPLDLRRYRGRRLFIPYISDHVFAYAGAALSAGLEAHLLPMPDADLSRRVERCTSGKECHPYGLLAADLDRLAEDHRAGDVYLVPGAVIPCLVQQYGEAMRFLLEERGVSDLEIFNPSMRGFHRTLGLEGAVRLFTGLLAIDLLLKATCALRPYEREPGRVDAVHRENLEAIRDGMHAGELLSAFRRCTERLAAVPVGARVDSRGRRLRPLVGVAGDIYTRVNEAANRRLFRRLEELGCEVWPPPTLVDLAEYGVATVRSEALRTGDVRDLLLSSTVGFLMGGATRILRGRLARWLDGRDEPDLERAHALAGPYIGRANMDLLQFNVAKLAHFAEDGADGLLNVVGQGCMVGTISAAITRRLRSDHGGVPLANLVYGPTDSPTEPVVLEAFVHQVRRRFESRS
jgi:predicted CoA-substrate-specific enzyme activase